MARLSRWILAGYLVGLVPDVLAQPLAIEAPVAVPSDERIAPLPSLAGLVALALANDSGLRSQRFDSQATAQELELARAGLRPRLDASASYRYQDADNIYTNNPADYPDEVYDDRVSGETHENSWELRLTQPLFSLERWRRIDMAEAQADAATLQVAVAERDLAITVVETYLDAYQASRTLGLLNAQRESLVLQQRQASRAYDLGIGDRLNLLESQSRLDQAIADQTASENDLANALSDLERLTGAPLAMLPALVGTPEALSIAAEPRPLETWLAATRDNVSVRLAAEQEQVAQRDTEVRRAGHYPEVDLVVGYSDLDSDDELRTSQDFTASVEVTLPIYQGGYTSASIRQGELAALAGAASLDNEWRLAQQEVRKRLRSMQGDLRQLEALQRSIESGALFLQAATRGQSLGLRDLVDVLDARSSLYDLRIRFVETVCVYLRDRTHLAAAVGELDTPSLGAIGDVLERVEQTPIDETS
ncbi:TolC family protein [Salinicola avicenniae]|uniref:TolC family protein n=1 Tax=Salinicola avicenniae TaxID=2916836 RepID=UPI002072B11D|nr:MULTISPECIES: TolC family protein [unclassified Salinicola]